MYTSGFGFSFSCSIRKNVPYSSFLQRTVLITFLLLFVFSGSFRWLGLFTFAVNSVTQTLTNSQFSCVPVCLVGYSDVCTCEMLHSLLYCLSPSPVHLVFALN